MRKVVVEYLADYAKQQPDQLAVVSGKNTATYAELWNYVKGFSRYLKELIGLKKGERVAVKASQTLEYVVCYMAVHLAGGIFVPVERTISEEGFRHIIETVGSKIVISNPVYTWCDSCIDSDDILKLAKNNFSPDYSITFPNLEDSADILFTTGTTGSSKGVELSHRALTATAENLIYGLEMKPKTQIIVPGPVNHANPIRKIFTSIVNGSTVILLNGMTNIKAFFNILDHSQGVLACCLPPAMIRTIFQITGDKIGEYANKIDFIESATSPLPEPDKLKLCRLLPNTRLYNNYGSSEAASVCMYNYNQYRGKVNCVGKPMPNSQIIIVDDNGNKIQSSPTLLGTLACVGDVNMKGYWDDPDMTRDVLKDGIVYTSDIGYIDSDGFVYVIGRKGDVINVGGLKVAPTEVEAVALGYDGIDDCICAPVEDKITGKAVKLAVVLKPGIALDVKSIRSYLAKRLETYKIPKYIVTIDQVPRTYNGKIDRKQAI